MLSAMRKSVGSTFVKIFIFGLLIVSFGLWGISDYVFSTGQSGPAAVVGDDEITVARLSDEYRRDLQRMNAAAIDPEQAQALGLARQTLQRLIGQSLLDQESYDLGLTATDNQVRQRLQSDPSFQSELGGFDPDRYRAILRTTGTSPTAYEANLRREVARSQLAQAMVTGIQAPQVLVDTMVNYRTETRTADYLTVTVNESRKLAAPDDAELNAFYEAEKESFREPELRQITYLSLNAEAVAKTIEVSDDEIRQAYDNRLAEFTVPAQRSYRQMLFSDQDKAETAAKRLQDGEAFEDVAADMLGDVDIEDLTFGPLGRAEIPDDAVAAAVFDTDPDTVPDAIEGAFGWTVVEITSSEGGTVMPFEDLKDRLREEQALNEAIELVYSLSNDLFDQLGGGASLEEVSETLNLPLKKIDGISRSGVDASGNPVDVPAPNQFLSVAFETEIGADSFITETENDGYFVLRVEGAKPSRIPDLSEIRDRVVDAWKAAQRHEAAASQAEELAERIRNGDAISKAASSAGVTWATSGAISRDARETGGLGQEAAQALFEMKQGEVNVIETSDGFVVARLNSINQGQRDFDEMEALANQLRIGMAGDLLDQYVEALRSDYGVEIRDEGLSEVYFPNLAGQRN
ncbi:MAG: SurA N-terminal domain-containing protein [Alphaproteobacteria bacterium]